jgi:hypothetical protein
MMVEIGKMKSKEKPIERKDVVKSVDSAFLLDIYLASKNMTEDDFYTGVYAVNKKNRNRFKNWSIHNLGFDLTEADFENLFDEKTSIPGLIPRLRKLEKYFLGLGYKKVVLAYFSRYGGGFDLKVIRDETDEEFEIRKSRILKRRATSRKRREKKVSEQEKKERAQLAKLKAKYEE